MIKLSHIRNKLLILLLSIGYITPATAVSDEEFNALQQRLEALADAVEANSGHSNKTHIGGYGELHYNNLSNGAGPQKKKIDFHRFVLFIGHEFTDGIRLHSEFELEHALVGDTDTDGTSINTTPGEVELEQAYVQFDISQQSTLSTGVFLMPVGIINETHEPPTFYGTERNPIEKNIIPATWWEAGAMYSAHDDSGLSYDIAVTSGLDGGTNIRGGRQKVADAKANNLALTGRIKYTGVPGLELSGSLSLQDDMTQDSTDNIDGATLIEAHLVWNTGAFTLKNLYAQWNINGAGATAGNKDKQFGNYIEASYKTNPNLGFFVRHNIWDNGGNEKTQSDIGLNYWAHENVVFKADLQMQDAAAGDSDGFNIGFGYHF